MDSPFAGTRVVEARCKTYQPFLQVHMSKLLAKRGVNFEDRLVFGVPHKQVAHGNDL